MKKNENASFLKFLFLTIGSSLIFIIYFITAFPESIPPRPKSETLMDFLNPDLVSKYKEFQKRP